MLKSRPIIVPVVLVMSLLALSCKKKKGGDDLSPPKSSVKTINSFTITAADNSSITPVDIAGQIGSDTITVTFDEGVNLANVTATVTFAGASVSPLSRSPQNFTNPLSYTVTAEDGSTKRYHIKVNRVAGNARVYVGSNDNSLYALNAVTGTLIWKYTVGYPIQSSPLVVNGTVYVGCVDSYLYAINAATGTLKWGYRTDYPIEFQSPAVGGNAVFISNYSGYPNGHVYAIDTTTGLLKWKSGIIPLPCSPLYAEGKIIVCSFGGTFAYNAETGNVLWNVASGITRTNAAYYNGRVYFCGEGRFYCVNIGDGSIVWSKTNMPPTISSPTIENGIVYCGSGNDMVAMDAVTGTELWRRQSNGGLTGSGPGIFSSPVLAGSILYADNNDSYFYALNIANGTNAWTKGSGAMAVSMGSPTVANGVVFVGRYDSYVYAYDAINGNERWKFRTNGAVQSGPCVVDTRGTVYSPGISGAKN
jgi:eukaryotic-like serine/threonine-protein kinase